MSGGDNTKFNVELTGTEELSHHVEVMLIRECTNFVTTFAGEWLKNIKLIAEHGITLGEGGELHCVRRHFKGGAYSLGKLTDHENIMALGETIMTHDREVTHLPPEAEEGEAHVPTPAERRAFSKNDVFRNGSTCGPDCPTHSHRHIRKVVGD